MTGIVTYLVTRVLLPEIIDAAAKELGPGGYLIGLRKLTDNSPSEPPPTPWAGLFKRGPQQLEESIKAALATMSGISLLDRVVDFSMDEDADVLLDQVCNCMFWSFDPEILGRQVAASRSWYEVQETAGSAVPTMELSYQIWEMDASLPGLSRIAPEVS